MLLIAFPAYKEPRTVSCMTRWPRRRITHITDRGAIKVDGVHRHRADIRPVKMLNLALVDEGEVEGRMKGEI